MKYIGRELKGSYLYIKKQFIFELIKTIILFLMAFGLYYIGVSTLGTKKSLWTVFAVLAMLPAAKSLVGVIMFARYKSLSLEQYKLYKEAAGDISIIVENVITTEKKSYYLPCIACENNTIIAYCNVSNSSMLKPLNEHLENVLKLGGYTSATLKIFDKEDAFLARLKQMNQNLEYSEKKASTEAIFTTIKAVSL